MVNKWASVMKTNKRFVRSEADTSVAEMEMSSTASSLRNTNRLLPEQMRTDCNVNVVKTASKRL